MATSLAHGLVKHCRVMQIYSRQFVLVPMNDIAPDWEDPLNGRAVKSLLADLLAREGKIPFRTVTGEED